MVIWIDGNAANGVGRLIVEDWLPGGAGIIGFPDKASLTQNFFINDNLVSSLTSLSLPITENLLVGDLSAVGMYGTLYILMKYPSRTH